MNQILPTLCATAYLACLLAAAGWDCACYRIPNRLVLATAAAAGLGLALAPGRTMPVEFLLTSLLVLAGGALLFFFRVWGAGDAKLLAAASLATGPHGLPVLLLWTALAGGFLAAFLLIIRRLPILNPVRAKSRGVALLSPAQGVPYGAAIAAGGVAAYFGHATILAAYMP